ncbi:probable integral membrane protein NMA1898 [hydrothermal vent metagenome]|uniref:Probable integral membrane protein NMA1898 n=1 Tax=hydrothermal vent metagenome TaxID=652676 RepID=A0A1W1D084_9ZZZZ
MNKRESLHPQFAVVGHPNKGKSSIVSSLALDDSVHISDVPGTTTKQRSFPLKVDGIILYELLDTPGFQRARRVLAWLQKHKVSADKRHEVVENFINVHRYDEKFNDEIELLDPIMKGAGIIYVVDASKPYGKEYEAEMEILRWTGQPSMALINHIEDSDYSQEWKYALGQYFKMVRTFNPMKTDREQHISILESMSQLKEEWIAPIKHSIKLFEQYQAQMLHNSAKSIALLVKDSLACVEKIPLFTKKVKDSDKEKLEVYYKETLRKLERKSQENIEKIWNHEEVKKEQALLSFDELDLFSEESASVFGLTRKELMLTGVTSGAVTGAGIDLLFVGHTLLLGGAIGAVVGGVGAYFGFKELSDIKVLGQKLGKKYLEIGPMENRNFPYILLGRAIFHAYHISSRSHAKRDIEELSMDSTFKEKWLEDTLRKSLESHHKQFRSGDSIDTETIESYTALVEGVLGKLIV